MTPIPDCDEDLRLVLSRNLIGRIICFAGPLLFMLMGMPIMVILHSKSTIGFFLFVLVLYLPSLFAAWLGLVSLKSDSIVITLDKIVIGPHQWKSVVMFKEVISVSIYEESISIKIDSYRTVNIDGSYFRSDQHRDNVHNIFQQCVENCRHQNNCK